MNSEDGEGIGMQQQQQQPGRGMRDSDHSGGEKGRGTGLLRLEGDWFDPPSSP